VTIFPTTVATDGFEEIYEIGRPEDATARRGKEASPIALSTKGGNMIVCEPPNDGGLEE
jgi:hypothetical protein